MLPHPSWDERESLRIVIGPWGCEMCGFDYQWAEILFEVTGHQKSNTVFAAQIASVDTFVPETPEVFDKIHYVYYTLAEFVNYPESSMTPAATIDYFNACQLTKKICNLFAHIVNGWSIY